MYIDETVLVLNSPTLLKTLWRPLDVCSWLFYFGDGMLSPSHYSITVLAYIPVFQSLNIIVLQAGGITQ
jgi:hypothetical protein